MKLKGKNIIILSPQSWGTMYISKHHYALELVKRDNTVYFINPPEREKSRKGFVQINQSQLHPNLFIVNHQLFFPYKLRFKAASIFRFLMKFHIKKIMMGIGIPIDVVWSFDLGNLYPLPFFGNVKTKVFHPVDEPIGKYAIDAAQGADVIFSVTNEILAKYDIFTKPKYFINHGVQEYFIAEGQSYIGNDPIRIGFSANLLRKDIDRDILLRIIDENQKCKFEFFGSYEAKQSNIGGQSDLGTDQFVEDLRKRENVILHGAVPSTQLAEELRKMDALLICYDVQKDQSKGTNYHKVMEYIATGRVVISNNITTYKDMPNLVQMVTERDNNLKLPGLFKKVINNLIFYNSDLLMKERIAYARSNTYGRQINRIEELLTVTN